ncbi:hypothetical protein [Crocosphaera chwakensis]|uniref:Uncharacterized protein n=1 Tax=Crocosphaera chwakensis CCY0110 TaxID=391612 RepID=A3IQJ4_9CHRO|nr:hypothetical protein [Crocosphaera chwakensis]EAZ91269.1 hypothetical protein CY0110_11617 [Crocosphaera chwakensis CCY0110]
MAGFFGLFSGRKAKFVDEPDNTSAQPQKKEAFFLDNDSAKSLGDTEFMRKPITIRRTFAKGGELVQDISSLEKKKAGTNNTSPSNQGNKTTTSSGTASINTERRKADSSMDMFRNMARSMKK